MAFFRVENMTHYFGGLRAVHNYNLEFEPGQIRGLIGPNGAGKTTIFNLITGVYSPTAGQIFFQGQRIVHPPPTWRERLSNPVWWMKMFLPPYIWRMSLRLSPTLRRKWGDLRILQPYEIAARGIGRTFQNLLLWRHMTVLEHVKMARYSRITYGLFGAFFGTPKRHREEAQIEEKAYSLLKMLGIDHLADEIVTNLPYGVQRRVEMARALAVEPKILFLDEPTAGMTPDELIQIMKIIRQIHKEFGLAIFLIEHRMKFVMELCESIQTLDFGEIIAEGTPEEIQNNPKVIDAYLGKEIET